MISPSLQSLARPLLILSSVTISVLIILYFHDRFWWQVDEGVYAYVADQILQGRIPHRDFTDLHGGIGNYVNALAFYLFGIDLLSLRYPLVAMALGQLLLGYLIIRPYGLIASAVGLLAIASYSFIQFPNPSANWHALFLAFLSAFALQRLTLKRLSNIILIGVLLGLCFLTRQLSGVLLAMGVLCWMLYGLRQRSAFFEGKYLVARVLILVMLIGLVAYLISKGSVAAVLIYGPWPTALLVWLLFHGGPDNQTTLRIISGVLMGALIAAIPLAIHYTMHGALGAWLHDMLFAALMINNQPFIASQSFFIDLLFSLGLLLNPRDWVQALSGLYWIILILLPLISGGLILHRLINNQLPETPLLLIAPFWSLVAVHYEIPIYLFFALPPTLIALIAIRPKPTIIVILLLVSAWGVAFQAGQPLSRGVAGTLRSERINDPVMSTLPRVSLLIEKDNHALLSDLLDQLKALEPVAAPLFTIPMEPHLNFMTRRQTPVDYYGTPLGLKSEADVEKTILKLIEAAPVTVVFNRDDKYNSPLTKMLVDRISASAAPVTQVGPFDLFVFDPDQPA